MGSRIRSSAPGIAALVVTGLWLALLFLNVELWLPVLLIGYIIIVPVVAIIASGDTDDTAHSSSDGANTPEDRALATLRDRYANGELTDEQFERKLERLLEVETLEDIEDRHGDPTRTSRTTETTGRHGTDTPTTDRTDRPRIDEQS